MRILIILCIQLFLCTSIYADDFVYRYNGATLAYKIISAKEQTVRVASGHYHYKDVVIPSQVEYQGNIFTVTSISDYAFRDCKELKSIVIPNTVTHIGWDAFINCSNLECGIPKSVNKIEVRAFSGCKKIYCEAQSKPAEWKKDWSKNTDVVWGADLAAIFNYNKESSESGTPLFSVYAKKIVESELNEWQKKGEFEKVDDWKQRVTNETRNAKIKELSQKAEKTYIEKYQDKKTAFELGEYDAENEVFMVENQKYGHLLVPVPIEKASIFKQQWSSISKETKYIIENDTIALAEVLFSLPGGEQYKYSHQTSLNYEMAEIDYNFEPLELDLQTKGQSTARGQQTITSSKKILGVSDIDTDIPISNVKSDNTFAVIIANEDYQQVAQVPYAVNDGRVFAEYCRKVLGLNDNNIHFVDNATLNNMKFHINWLKNVIEAYNGEARVIFYYAGHGIPDESQKTAYLLPIDGYGTDVSTGYKLDDLYSTLGNLPSKSVTVFLDACFSGANRDGQMLASARGVAIKAKSSAPVGNMVVFSAAQGDETAYPNNEQQHGMFTYYLLKKIKETEGDVTYKDLGDYVTDNVRKQSIVVNGKSQTPVVVPSATVGGNWESWKLK
ncbi:MAG: caspase family protein [Salinivirgaceae bacterium]|nr:caspase family protein [Salinivirgaceae bacterium]